MKIKLYCFERIAHPSLNFAMIFNDYERIFPDVLLGILLNNKMANKILWEKDKGRIRTK